MFFRILLFYFILILSLSCSQSKNIQNSEYIQTKQLSDDDSLNGDWRMTGYSAYMPIEDFERMPDFSSISVIYSIALRDYKLSVVRDLKKEEYDFTLPSGEYKIWANRSMVKIGNSLYMYQIDKDNLTLDSNYDPSYGPDGIVFTFDRMQ